MQVAPLGTRGTFRLEALSDNTAPIAFGGEPHLHVGGDERDTDGPISAAATQNAPLYDAGYGLYVEGDLGLWWVDVRVSGEGACWLRVK